MPKKTTAKVKVKEAEASGPAKKPRRRPKKKAPDPLVGPDFAAFSTEAFQEAVAEVWARQQRQGQDSYGTVDGELVAIKPDGRVEPVRFEVKDRDE